MVVLIVTNIWMLCDTGCSLTSWETISFPRRALSMKLGCVASSQGYNVTRQHQLQHVAILILTPRDFTWQWLLLHKRQNGTAFHHVQESQWLQIGSDPEITARSNTLCYDFYCRRTRCIVWLQIPRKVPRCICVKGSNVPECNGNSKNLATIIHTSWCCRIDHSPGHHDIPIVLHTHRQFKKVASLVLDHNSLRCWHPVICRRNVCISTVL